jgi:hypothetical protein
MKESKITVKSGWKKIFLAFSVVLSGFTGMAQALSSLPVWDKQ